MMINRNNYESFFLLAVDNELSAPERNVLDEFLKNNPDLQEEFDLLQKSIMPLEDVVYKNKISLLKSESISAEMEEKILLFIDDEIKDEDEINTFKTAMADDFKLRAEFQILRQTKLIPDTSITFGNKKLLYKKEAGKVIPFGWMKFAAAAIFIGVGIWGAVKYLPVNNNSSSEIAVKTPLLNQVSKRIAKTDPAAAPLFQETEITKTSPLTEERTIAKTIVKPSLQTTKKQEDLKGDNIVVAEQKLNKPDNNLPTPYYEKSNSKSSNNNEINAIDKLIGNTADDDIAFNNKPAKNTNTALQNQVYTTSFTDNTDTKKEDQFRFADEDDEPKKSRLSGFLRKAKRVFERNTKIKASNENLKVANFEFATQ